MAEGVALTNLITLFLYQLIDHFPFFVADDKEILAERRNAVNRTDMRDHNKRPSEHVSYFVLNGLCFRDSNAN
jgi:hypothetical protein